MGTLAHRWATVTLAPSQDEALRRVDTHLARGESALPICLIGETGSGKTTLARYWLASNFDAPEERLLSLNRIVLDTLKQEGALAEFAANPSKTRVFGRIAVEDALERRFAANSALVLDGLEIAVAHDIPVIEIAAAHTRKKRIAILCVPSDISESPLTRDFGCRSIRLGSRTNAGGSAPSSA